MRYNCKIHIKQMQYLSKIILIIFLTLLITSQAQGCGNGTIEGTEQCDDGNTINGDGCNSVCLIQADYRCQSSPSICKIDILVGFQTLGIFRDTKKNTATFIFSLNEQYDLLKKINFQSIFYTDIPYTSISVSYDSSKNMILAIIDFTENLENTVRNFQILFANTPYFWYNSTNHSFELNGANCELTYQDDIPMHNIFSYIMYATIAIVFIVVFVSIAYEKWIGLELIQTYQTVFYIFLLMKEFPYELRALTDSLRYSQGYDDVIADDIMRIYKLSNSLNGLSIEKEFFVNFNISFGIILTLTLILVILALRRAYLKNRLESEINRKLNKQLDQINAIFNFVFGEVFIMVKLIFMLKIIAMFIVELNMEEIIQRIFINEVSVCLATLSFIMLFIVITYIANWFVMIPENLTENDRFQSLQFRNMKFHYPIIYLIYQALFIFTVSIFYAREYTIEVVISLQIVYFCFLIWLWPYNTTRKVNRILHNFTILFNQFIGIFASIVVMRWRVMLPGGLQIQSNFQSLVYFFILSFFLIVALVLAIFRLAIFNKDVDCNRNQENEEKGGVFELNGGDDNSRLLTKREPGFTQFQDPILPSLTAEQKKMAKQARELPLDQSNLNRFLNDKYIHWVKGENEGIHVSKRNLRNMKRTVARKAELIKSPLEQYLQLQKLRQNQNTSN